MIDMEFRKTEHPSVRQGGWIRSRVFASILSATLLMSPISSLGFELNAGRIPFEGDKSVCQAFTSYFRHEAELIARERAEGREGISVHSYLTTRRDSWGGISVPELPKADSEYADSNAIGYQLGDALGSHEQASQMFKADLFQNGDIRTVLITTEDSQRPRSSILILKPNKHLKVFAFQNAFYPEMTIFGPAPEDVDMKIGTYDIVPHYIDIKLGNMPKNDDNGYVSNYDKYYLYWDKKIRQSTGVLTATKYFFVDILKIPTHDPRILQIDSLSRVRRSDFVYRGAGIIEDAKLLERALWIDELVTGSSGLLPQKAFSFGGAYYFVKGIPISQDQGTYGWQVYHVTPEWKLQVDCDLEPSIW